MFYEEGRTDVKRTVFFFFCNFAIASDSGTRYVSNQMNGSYQQIAHEKYHKTMIIHAIFKSSISPLLHGKLFHIKRNTVWETLLYS